MATPTNNAIRITCLIVLLPCKIETWPGASGCITSPPPRLQGRVGDPACAVLAQADLAPTSQRELYWLAGQRGSGCSDPLRESEGVRLTPARIVTQDVDSPAASKSVELRPPSRRWLPKPCKTLEVKGRRVRARLQERNVGFGSRTDGGCGHRQGIDDRRVPVKTTIGKIREDRCAVQGSLRGRSKLVVRPSPNPTCPLITHSDWTGHRGRSHDIVAKVVAKTR